MKGFLNLRRSLAVPAILLALTPGFAWADAAPPSYRAKTPQSQGNSYGTAQTCLAAARTALQAALKPLNDVFAEPTTQTAYLNPRLLTVRYGGYFDRAREDINQGLADVAAAAAFVDAHPEASVIVAGAAPAETPTLPLLPEFRSPYVGGTWLVQVVDNLGLARNALINSSLGPGDFGGFRAKIMADLSRAGSNLATGILYDRNFRGGNTGIISLTALPPPAPDPKFGPTTRTHLEAIAQEVLGTLRDLSSVGVAYTGDRTQGGYLPKTRADLDQIQKDVNAALTFLNTHPEAIPLCAGPSKADSPSIQDVILPHDYAALRYGTSAFRSTPALNASTIYLLNEMLLHLTNNPASDSHSLVLGDIGGFRSKIREDIAQAQADAVEGLIAAFGPIPAVTPTSTEAPIAPTTQAHLAAAQIAVNQAISVLRASSANLTTVVGGQLKSNVTAATLYGDGFALAITDLTETSAQITEALTYVHAHPEINALTPGAVPANSLPAPRLPLVFLNPAKSNLSTATQDLHVALAALVNNSARDNRDPVLGDIQGLRQKIVDGIGRAGTDLSSAVDYFNTHTEDQGVLPQLTAGPQVMAKAEGSPASSVIASIALGTAFSLGGLFLSSRSRQKRP